MSSNASDPRDPSLETKFNFPRSWTISPADPQSTSAMFLAGLVMVTKNRVLAWPNLLFALSGIFNAHPLRTKEGGNGWSGLTMAFFAVITAYVPYFIPTATPTTPAPA